MILFTSVSSTFGASENDIKKFQELSAYFRKNNLQVYRGIKLGMTKESLYLLSKNILKDNVKCGTSLKTLCILDITENQELNIKEASFIFYDNVLISFFFYVDKSSGKKRKKHFRDILKKIDTSKFFTQYKNKNCS